MFPAHGRTIWVVCIAATMISAGTLFWLSSQHVRSRDNPAEIVAREAEADESGSPVPTAVFHRAEAVDEDTIDLAPGLLAHYRSLPLDSSGPELLRIDSKPAFTFGESSPHPRFPPGPFAIN